MIRPRTFWFHEDDGSARTSGGMGIQNETHCMVAYSMVLALHAKDGCQRTRGFNTMVRAATTHILR